MKWFKKKERVRFILEIDGKKTDDEVNKRIIEFNEITKKLGLRKKDSLLLTGVYSKDGIISIKMCTMLKYDPKIRERLNEK